jgi:hypothetical protein
MKAVLKIGTLVFIIISAGFGCVSKNKRTLSNVPDSLENPSCTRSPGPYANYPQYALDDLGGRGYIWRYICNTDFAVAFRRGGYAKQDLATYNPDVIDGLKCEIRVLEPTKDRSISAPDTFLTLKRYMFNSDDEAWINFVNSEAWEEKGGRLSSPHGVRDPNDASKIIVTLKKDRNSDVVYYQLSSVYVSDDGADWGWTKFKGETVLTDQRRTSGFFSSKEGGQAELPIRITKSQGSSALTTLVLSCR